MKSNYWSVNVLADAVPDKYVLQCCSIYSDPHHIGVLCTQVILPLHLAPSRHFLQFMVPVWPIPLHSLSVLKGMTPHSHTITCCLSHTLTLSSCLSKSLSLIDAYIYLFHSLSFFHFSLLLQGSCCHISCISSLMDYQETLTILQPACSVKATKHPTSFPLYQPVMHDFSSL